jgi:hypothetical protein
MKSKHNAIKRVRLLGSVLAVIIGLVGYGQATTNPRFEINLRDGSMIVAQATSASLPFRADIAEDLKLDWAGIQSLKFEDGKVLLEFPNGDRLSGHLLGGSLTVGTALGQISIADDQILAITEITISDDQRENIALGKKVSGRDGASHGKGLAAHVTDGDTSTHAKPPSFGFCYTVDLGTEDDHGSSVGEIAIHWGRFGDRFKGVRNGEGWASGSWPGEYVKSYRVEYRCVASDDWIELHQWKGRPAEESGAGVKVDKRPTQLAGCSSESTTTIDDLNLENVGEIRISAQGGHWIGLFELEVFRAK